jgi:hypothetical protein
MEAPTNPWCAPLPTALAGGGRVAERDDLARDVEDEDLQDLGVIAEAIDRRLEPRLFRHHHGLEGGLQRAAMSLPCTASSVGPFQLTSP